MFSQEGTWRVEQRCCGETGLNCTTQSEIPENPPLSNTSSRLLQAAALTQGPRSNVPCPQLHTLSLPSLSHFPAMPSALGHVTPALGHPCPGPPHLPSRHCHRRPLDTEEAGRRAPPTPALRMLGQEKVISNYYYYYNYNYFVPVSLFLYAKAKLLFFL